MVRLFIAVLLLVGCGDSDSDKIATPEEPVLDTARKTNSQGWFIRRWNAETLQWVATQEMLNAATSWRFTSHRESTRGVVVTGGYTAVWENTAGEGIDVGVSKISFADQDGILIAEYDIFPDDRFVVGPLATLEWAGIFEIVVGDISVANEIVEILFWATVSFPVSAKVPALPVSP